MPLDVVIEFKRDVYQRALQELSRFLTWPANGHDRRQHGSRYLRQPHAPRPNPEPPGSACAPAEAASTATATTVAAVAAGPAEPVKSDN